jgi:riboflavin synthase
MFTGIITQTTELAGRRKAGANLELSFKKPKGWTDLTVGESVATNGVCLTVAAVQDDQYSCLLVPETLERSAFGEQLPAAVNLERSLRVGDRLSGHLVQGHVDAVGQVTAAAKAASASDVRLAVSFPPPHALLVVAKGSITVDGVALTVTEVTDDSFGVALVPHTLEHTTLGSLQAGDRVNLEFDIIGKYVARLLQDRTGVRV